jgi:hypothetical protein
VPIAGTALHAGTTITLIGLELYADGFLADFVVFPRGRMREPRLLIHCRDDRGQRHRARLWRCSTGGEAGHRWALTYALTPAPHINARALRLVVAKLHSRDRTAFQVGPWSFSTAL